MGDFLPTMLAAKLNTSSTKKVSLEKAHFILAHSGGDVIVFTKRGRKLTSEFDN